jgi:hypothetical protein
MAAGDNLILKGEVAPPGVNNPSSPLRSSKVYSVLNPGIIVYPAWS